MILGPLLLFWNPAQALVRRWPFIYCILPRTIYSWIKYLDLKGKNEIQRKIVFPGFQPKSSTWQKRESRGYKLGSVEQTGWNVIIWRILDICIILHEPPAASDLRQGMESIVFSFFKTILSLILNFACFVCLFVFFFWRGRGSAAEEKRSLISKRLGILFFF